MINSRILVAEILDHVIYPLVRLIRLIRLRRPIPHRSVTLLVCILLTTSEGPSPCRSITLLLLLVVFSAAAHSNFCVDGARKLVILAFGAFVTHGWHFGHYVDGRVRFVLFLVGDLDDGRFVECFVG